MTQLHFAEPGRILADCGIAPIAAALCRKSQAGIGAAGPWEGRHHGLKRAVPDVADARHLVCQ